MPRKPKPADRCPLITADKAAWWLGVSLEELEEIQAGQTDTRALPEIQTDAGIRYPLYAAKQRIQG